jgi:hypothetical protein
MGGFGRLGQDREVGGQGCDDSLQEGGLVHGGSFSQGYGRMQGCGDCAMRIKTASDFSKWYMPAGRVLL